MLKAQYAYFLYQLRLFIDKPF